MMIHFANSISLRNQEISQNMLKCGNMQSHEKTKSAFNTLMVPIFLFKLEQAFYNSVAY